MTHACIGSIMSSNDIFRNIGVNGYASGLMDGTI